MAIGYASKVYHCLASKVRLKIIPLNRNAQILVKVLQVIWNLICSWIAVSSESYVSLEKGIKILILKSNIVYVVPEFNPCDYDKAYPEQANVALQNENLDAFF